ncbi:hypothetical protein ACJX0J_023895, partial [Zea mays]
MPVRVWFCDTTASLTDDNAYLRASWHYNGKNLKQCCRIAPAPGARPYLLKLTLIDNIEKDLDHICHLKLLMGVEEKVFDEQGGRIVSSFVKDRNILEGVVNLHEINFEKAYDNVRWNFLADVLKWNEMFMFLVSLPMYIMGFYLLQKGGNFSWQGAEKRNKIYAKQQFFPVMGLVSGMT